MSEISTRLYTDGDNVVCLVIDDMVDKSDRTILKNWEILSQSEKTQYASQWTNQGKRIEIK